jgi:hypothetical protein
MMKIAVGMTLSCLGLCSGCGSSPAPQASPAGSAARWVAPPPAASSAAVDDEEPVPAELQGIPSAHPPPGENGMITLQALLPPPDPGYPPGFPAPATTNDKECVKAIGLLGLLDKDFAALTSACGAGTGMKEYAKAVSGSLDSRHKSNTFLLRLSGGYCYRFFAVADGSITKLGFRVHRANGALHSVILGKQPVIVFRPNETWCRRRDRDFQLVVEMLEGGEGRYAFGVWARPNEWGRRKD